jgi:hypothetical protein
MREATIMQAAVLEKASADGALDSDRLSAVVLVHIAAAGRGTAKGDLAEALGPIVAHRLAPARWKALLDREVEALAAASLVTVADGRIAASEAGIARTAIFLGLKGGLPRSADDLVNVRLIAKALGLEREPPKRQATLRTPDGLRAAIVQKAYGLKIRGAPSPSRLRASLAALALARAFGDQFKGAPAEKLGISAKAGRLLAGQLAKKPRNFGTDSRLVAALAAEHVGATGPGLPQLRIAVLRRYLDGGDKPAVLPRRQPAKPAATRPRLVEPAPAPVPASAPAPASPPPPAPAAGPPSLAGFADEVRRHALVKAQGWPGNRKAYISHVWQTLREARSDWGLSEIEFKCMLAEAHRTGKLALANADLKDNGSIKALQDSAVVYKNAVFHFIRVDG